MPVQKLVIEYDDDKPIFYPNHFKLEKWEYHSTIAWEALIAFLRTYSEEGIITPIYPLAGTISRDTPKYKRTDT